jgi:hypothetical protein
MPATTACSLMHHKPLMMQRTNRYLRRPERSGVSVFATDVAELFHKCLTGFRLPKHMTAEQIIKEIEALPKHERERLVQRMRELQSVEIPQDFIDALEDFEKGCFVSMETALNETPPDS